MGVHEHAVVVCHGCVSHAAAEAASGAASLVSGISSAKKASAGQRHRRKEEEAGRVRPKALHDVSRTRDS